MSHTKCFTYLLFVFLLLISDFSVAREIIHNVASGSLSISANSTDHYIITGTTTNKSHYVVVQSGFEGTITLRNLDMEFSGSGIYSPIRITGQNNRSNLNPVTKVTIILDGNNVIKNDGGGRACIQVDQGAQIHIKAIFPAYNLSGTLCVQQENAGGGAAIGALNHYNNTNECTGSAQLQGSSYYGNNATTAGGNIVVSSGLVVARGGHGAGIGGGFMTFYDGIIFICGGIVNSTAIFDAAGIGSGCPTGNGLLNSYTQNSTIVVLPPAQIQARGAGGSPTGGVGYTLYPSLGLAGTKTLVYIGDVNKPLVTVRTEDNKAAAPIYADLSQNADIVRAYNAVLGAGSDQLDIHKVNFGKTNASGIYSFHGILQNPTTFFTDATSDNNQHYGEPYTSTTATLTNGGSVVLNRIGIDFSLQAQPSTPLFYGYNTGEANSRATRVKMIYRDNDPLTNVTFTMASGSSNQFGNLKFYQADGVTERTRPTSLNSGDVFYISVPLAVGKAVKHYDDVLLVSGNKSGNNIGYIRQVVDQWVVNVSYETTCESSFVLNNGRVVTESGYYFDTVTRGGTGSSSTVSFVACDGSSYSETQEPSSVPDSIVAMNVVFLRPVSDTIKRAACDRYSWNGTNYSNSGTYSRRLTASNGCDSLSVLRLTINRSSSGDIYDTACDSYSWYGSTYRSSTPSTQIHTHMLTNRYGCDSTLRLHLTLYPGTSRTDQRVACDSLVWHGTKYQTSNNTAVWHTTNHWGCDSAVTLNLVVKYSTNSQVDTTVCDRINWRCGSRTYPLTASTTNTYHIQNRQGCDSTVVLNLTVNYSAITYTDSTVCDSIHWNGGRYVTSGLYQFDTTTILSCDSAARLRLVVNYSNTSLDNVSECDAYVWNSTRYQMSGLYNFPTKNHWGCDSIAYLNLVVRYSTNSRVDTTVCDRIDWHCGSRTYPLTASAANTYHILNHQGCDSTVVLNLTVNYSAITYTDSTVCDSIHWNGMRYVASGMYQFDTTTILTCDSAARLRLVVNYSDTSLENTSVCDAYVWNSTRYETSGLYDLHTKNRWGCDSIAYLNLDVNYSYRRSFDTVVCDSILWNGRRLIADGNYFYRGYTSQGCDSLLMMTLRVHPSTVGYVSQKACDEYTWFGRTFTESCTPNHHSLNANGCDSNTFLLLTINHGSRSIENRTVCDSVYWKGEWRNASSEYTFDILDHNGCDSTIVLNLAVNQSSYDTVRAQKCDYFYWNGYPLLNSDTVQFLTGNEWGCDSLVTLYLTMNYSTSSIDTINSCRPVVWHGSEYSSSNHNATFVLENAVGCDSVIRLDLTIPQSYKAAFVLTPDYVEPDNMHFRATDKSEGNLNWRQWSVDEEILPYSPAFEYDYPNHVDSMLVQLIVREKMFGCLDTAARWIPLKGGLPFAPNIFTPEREEQNRFMVYLSNVKTFDINIYTREGALVFHSTDINEYWDGTWMGKGRKCPQSVYTYIVRYTTDISDDIQIKKGTVLLAY